MRGRAGAGLLESYDAERRPVGEEVVARTLRHVRSGIRTGPDDPTTTLLREAQLLVGYRGSPIVEPDGSAPDGPAPGDRAPDCGGLAYALASFPVRLFTLLREREHTLLLYADQEDRLRASDVVAVSAERAAPGLLNACAVLAPGLEAPAPGLPVVHDTLDEFRRTYGARGGEAFLVRPDGHLGLRTVPADGPALPAYLEQLFGVRRTGA